MQKTAWLCVFFTGFIALYSGANEPISASNKNMQLGDPQEIDTCYVSGLFRQEKQLVLNSEPIESRGFFLFSCQHGLIWHTSSPFAESLVYSTASTHYRVLENNELETLDGRVQRRLSTVLISLVGGNRDAVAKLFNAEVYEGATRYTPKSRRLKKFIESVEVIERKSEVDITIRHKQGQRTSIYAYQKTEHPVLDQEDCVALSPNLAKACDTLFNNE